MRLPFFSRFLLSICLISGLVAGCRKDTSSNSFNDDPPTMLSKKSQVIFTLAMMANVNYGLVAPSQAALVAHAAKLTDGLANDAAIRGFIGTDWQMVWGPVTSNSLKAKTTDSFVTDNTMYVVKGKDPATGSPLYVVAIAGTNIVSKKGWEVEDFNVYFKSAWGAPGSGSVSRGTQAGVNILLGMVDPVTNQSLFDFLDGLNKSGSFEIAFTGHSLGGALSPSLGLKAIEWRNAHGYSNMTISAYPVAGATPGDATFATYAEKMYAGNYHSVINAYDMVPHSWQADMLAQIPDLYNNSKFNGGKGLLFPDSLKATFNLVKSGIAGKNYTRISQSTERVFPGTPNVYTGTDTGTFFKEAGFQHTSSYFIDGFQIPQNVSDAVANLIQK